MTYRIQYWFSTASPWAWLASARFANLVNNSPTVVDLLPVDLTTVFSETGGTTFSQRSAARQSYRQLELARWSKRLGVPIILEPQHYPVDRGPSSRLLISTANLGKDALGLSHVILRAIWAEDQDISDWSTLTKLACQHGLDGNLLVEAAQHEGIEAQYRENTSRAIKAQVFGSPTFIVDGERFWGQDRLDFLADRILRC